MESESYLSYSEEDTRTIGKSFAEKLSHGDIITLLGDLGAGKTEFVRGVCSLVPGVKGVSENIEVVSIVDRFLEHARFFIFENNGAPLYYITSADLMERNLDKRIEVGTPILEPRLQKEIQVIFDTQWSDTTKSRIITKKLANKYKELDDQQPARSQMKLYEHYKQLLPTKK